LHKFYDKKIKEELKQGSVACEATRNDAQEWHQNQERLLEKLN